MRRRGKWNEEDRKQFQEKLGVMEGGKGELQEEIETRNVKDKKNNRGKRGWITRIEEDGGLKNAGRKREE